MEACRWPVYLFGGKGKIPNARRLRDETGTLLTMIFLVVFAVFHLLRLLFGMTIVIGSTTVPQWASILAFLVAGILAVMLWREGKR